MQTEKQIVEYPHRRRPWIAVCLSLVMPGLGQVYCGDLVRGIDVILVMTIFSVGWVVGMMKGGTPVVPFFLAAWGMVLLAVVFAAIDAYQRARRTRFDYQLKDYNNWGVYLALIWIGGAGTVGYTAMVKQTMFEAFRVPSHSMVPTIMAGDRLIASKLAYNFKRPKRGDVVLFNRPDQERGHYIKRVVALGGDTVELRKGQLLVNGQRLERTWVENKTLTIEDKVVKGDVFWETNGKVRYQVFISSNASEDNTQVTDYGPVTVPDYHCFVLGDNRNLSFDSRHFGTLSYGALKGKFTNIYWPLPNQSKI